MMKALRVTTYECKKFELTPLSERICVPNVVQIAPRSTHQKEDVYGLLTDSFIGRGRRTTFLENSQSVYDVHVRLHVAPPSVLPIC